MLVRPWIGRSWPPIFVLGDQLRRTSGEQGGSVHHLGRASLSFGAGEKGETGSPAINAGVVEAAVEWLRCFGPR